MLYFTRYWNGSWGKLIRGLVIFGVPTAAIVTCGLALWRLQKRKQQPKQLQQGKPTQDAIKPADPLPKSSCHTQVAPLPQAIEKEKKGGNEQTFCDSGYVDNPSFLSTSTPLPPHRLQEDFKSPDRPMTECPPLHLNTTQSNSIGPSYSSLPVDLRVTRNRATVQLPIDVVGRFIGRQGRNIKSLMAESGSQIHVQQKNLSRDATMVPCVLQGSNMQISKAIDLILLRHPEVVISPMTSQLFCSPISTINGSSLLMGNANDSLVASEPSWDFELKPFMIPESSFLAIATYIEKLCRLWLVPYSSTQQLDDLHQAMTLAYSRNSKDFSTSLNSPSSPPIPSSPLLEAATKAAANGSPVKKDIVGKYCAVRVSEIYWLRGKVTALSDEGRDYEVKLMDYGSSVIVPSHALKPLRKEHTQLPIQAFPCVLANVDPINADSEDGMVVLQALVEGTVLEVYLKGAKSGPDPAPLAELYVHQYGSEVQAFVNRELVNQGFAVWRESKISPELHFTPSSLPTQKKDIDSFPGFLSIDKPPVETHKSNSELSNTVSKEGPLSNEV